MTQKQKDNSIKIAAGIGLIGAFIGFLATHSLFGAFKGACVGLLIVFIGEFYGLFKEESKHPGGEL